MFCTQCGFKIEDGFKFCPNCGSQVGASNQVDTRSIPTRIADDVYTECPNDFYGAVIGLAERANIDYNTAKTMMFVRYHGKTESELKAQKRLFKHDRWRNNCRTDICPRCGSKYIDSYCEQGISLTSQTNVLGGMLITHHGNIDEGLKCMYCGYRWNPYKKK